MALLCLVSWLLAGWLANPQGILRRQKLSGFRPCGRCGTLVLEIPEDGSNVPWSPLAALAAPSHPAEPSLPFQLSPTLSQLLVLRSRLQTVTHSRMSQGMTIT